MRQQTVSYDGFATPIGRLWVAVSPRGVCRIAFDMPEEDFVVEVCDACGVEPTRDVGATAAARAQLLDYLAGRRRAFDLPLDLADVTEFQKQALSACAAIPYGETRSYTDLARQVGRAGAARAVGSAMAHNPLPLIIPCHRVLRSDGSLGGFGGGLPLKERLLKLEREHRPAK